MYHNGWDGLSWTLDDPGGSFLGSPAVTSWPSNRLDIFALDGNNTLMHNSWKGQWQSNWDSRQKELASDPAVTPWAEGRLDFLGVGIDFAMWHSSYNGSENHPQISI